MKLEERVESERKEEGNTILYLNMRMKEQGMRRIPRL